VLVALAWGAVASWLTEYERYAQATCARAGRLSRAVMQPSRTARTETAAAPPRRLFGLAFESRPPPLLA
jgi:hypothetical protein